jgi:hypothetical protein
MGGYVHWNLTGNKGSHYIKFYFYDWAIDSITFLNAVCPGTIIE